MPKLFAFVALVLVAMILPPTLAAENNPGDATGEKHALPANLVAALAKGGHVIYFRHAATDHKTHDVDRKNLENCATQRNLSALGRRQAAGIGKVFRKLGIPVGKVVSSPYCRCADTAKLAFGRVERSRQLIFALDRGRGETKRLALALRRMITAAPEAGTNTIIVGHTVNLREAANIWPKPEGVAVIFRPSGDGTISYVATVHPSSWPKTANER